MRSISFGRLFAKIFSSSVDCALVSPSACAMRGRFHHFLAQTLLGQRRADDEDRGGERQVRPLHRLPSDSALGGRRRRRRRGTSPPAAGRRRPDRPARAPASAAGVGTAAATGAEWRTGMARAITASAAAMPTTHRSGWGRRAGARRGGSRPWSRPPAPATRRSSGLRSRPTSSAARARHRGLPLLQRAAAGLAGREVRRQRLGLPRGRGREAEELGVGQVAFGLVLVHVLCLCLRPKIGQRSRIFCAARKRCDLIVPSPGPSGRRCPRSTFPRSVS